MRLRPQAKAIRLIIGETISTGAEFSLRDNSGLDPVRQGWMILFSLGGKTFGYSRCVLKVPKAGEDKSCGKE